MGAASFVSEWMEFYEREEREILADPDWERVHEAFLGALERGEVRAASPSEEEGGPWRVNAWVKRAILLGFKAGRLVRIEAEPAPFFDKHSYLPRQFEAADGVRMVPGGSAVRRGAHVAAGVVIMPPAYVNVGAYVGAGSMVDSHALIGSCAQIGRGVHVSAAAQIGGVLEPAGARPVIVEDGAFIGGLAGIFEGVWVGAHAVIAAGVVLTRSTPILDLVKGRELRGEVPAGAVVVSGTRSLPGRFFSASSKEAEAGAEAGAAGSEVGLRFDSVQVAAAVILKYRDARTDAAVALESALRGGGA